ncbi:hypothetical protein F5B22DRAFT_127091 [Xylaria bambusicola]|uniref:uncharacterized protein n=1 Tax=Xylaria bambusicola TaxID=326684 RepID=UPI002007A92C|nr:uncharacterized protein F5B22DRAFT_127091 [Xylaria bambusicola]KAI0517099.1 hypothetical protein F5B22DRAFT_127091 [Xylaria bambusicola]
MYTSTTLLYLAAFFASANAHGAIINAQGIQGSPSSVGFKVHSDIPRNCTSINPCQQDTTIIRDAEISANIVNECGRTELDGNIDIGENTENALAANAVTQVKAGGTVDVTIHQVNADGAGPYACDVIAEGNNGVITFPNVQVDNNVPGVNGFSQAKEEQFTITVTMPQDLNCTGSSAGNICTVRCRNNALAGPFGGCFPVQQIDTQAVTLKSSDVGTKLSLEKVQAQVSNDINDLPAALAANQRDGTDEAKQAAAAVTSLLNISVVSKAAPTNTQEAAATTTAADPVATSDAANNNNNGNNNNNNGNNGNGGFNNGNGGFNNGGNGGFGRGNGNNRFGGNNGFNNGKRTAKAFSA